MNKYFLLNLLISISLIAQTSDLSITWDKNPEPDVWRYNVYRGSSPAPTANVGYTAHPDTVYNDFQVQKGTLYYYRITAIDFSQNESGYSNEVSAAIPLISGLPSFLELPPDTSYKINLNNFVSDPDQSAATLNWTSGSNTLLTVSVNNTINELTIQTPLSWNATEAVTVSVYDDDLLSDSHIITVQSTQHPNIAPQISPIPNQTINEGGAFANIPLDDFVTDPDNPDELLTWNYGGNSSLVVNISNDRVATITTPNVNWFGSETIIFQVQDPGGLSDLDTVVFTVTNVNDPPVISSIPDQTIQEGSTFNTITLDNYVTDIDNPDNQITWTASGQSQLNVSINTSRVAQITVPNVNWFGSETITFKATDPSGASSQTQVDFTVNNVNDPPVVTAIPGQSVPEGSNFTTITLDNFVSDVDNTDEQMVWTASGEINLNVTIGANRTAQITAVDVDWNGTETIRFKTADPGGLADSTEVDFEVTPVNDPPVISNIPNQSISRRQSFAVINLNQFATDIDNSSQDFSWSVSGTNKITINFSQDSLAQAIVNDTTWVGSDTVSFRVTDSAGAFDEDDVIYTVNDIGAPVISGIPGQTISEGNQFSQVNLDDFVDDPDNSDDQLTWSATGQVDLTVTIDGSRVATIAAPDTNWYGSELITFRVSDPDNNSVEDDVTFEVTNINDAPVFTDVPSQTTLNGIPFPNLDLKIYAADIDNDFSELTWTYSGNTDLDLSISTNGIVQVTPPNQNWTGSELITFRVTDPGALFDEDTTRYTILASNNDPPQITPIPDQEISEGSQFDLINLDDYVEDGDHNDTEISWTISGFDRLAAQVSADRVMQITIPDTNWFGADTLMFRAQDPVGASDYDTVVFRVLAVNDPPVVANIPNQFIQKGEQFSEINLYQHVSDADNLKSELNWVFEGNESFAINVVRDSIAEISIVDTGWVGKAVVTFRAIDPGGLSGYDDAILAVNDQNAPVTKKIPDQTINEGETFASVSLDGYVVDPDHADNEISWEYSGNSEIIVSINQNRVAQFTIPGQNWFGSEQVFFRATDPSGSSSETNLNLVVNSVNDAPQVSTIPGQIIAQGSSFSLFNLDNYVTDIDNAKSFLTWTVSGNSNLNVLIDQSRNVFIVNTNADWAGTESLIFRATDPGGLFDETTADFTVNNADAPIISGLSDQIILEGYQFDQLHLDDFVTDANNSDDEIVWTISGNTELLVNLDAGRVLSVQAPDTNWYGSELLNLKARDPVGLTNEISVNFTVINVNDRPIFETFEDQIFSSQPGEVILDLFVHVSDVDHDISQMQWSYYGNNYLQVTLNQTGLATIALPGDDWNGREVIYFKVTDAGGMSGQAAVLFALSDAMEDRTFSVSTNNFGGGNNISFNWQTTEATSDYIEYGLTTEYGNISDKDEEFSTSHEQVLSDLQPNSLFHFRIVSEDGDGIVSYSQDATFQTGNSGALNVFPIPFVANQSVNANYINFTNLPENSEITILNLLGEPVYKIRIDQPVLRWDVKNNAGKDVQSGLYMFVIRDQDEKKVKTGKIVIIR